MVHKEPIDAQRLRQIPKEGFSWIDRRFIREGFSDPLPPQALLLYFFLVAVGDARGLSFYAEGTIRKILKLDAEELSQARSRLISAGLILYRYPLYQVLELPPRPVATSKPAPVRPFRNGEISGEPTSLAEILRMASERSGSASPPGRRPPPPAGPDHQKA
jgi:hypothetical protein